MWGKKARRIEHLVAHCDRMANEKADAKQQVVRLEHNLHACEALLAEAHNLIDGLAGTLTDVDERVRHIRSKFTEARRVPGQEEVVRGLVDQADEPEPEWHDNP